MDYLFSGKILCLDCHMRHKAKKARNKRIYVCSNYDKNGKNACSRNKVDQDELLSLLLDFRYKNISIEEVLPKIESIEVNMDKIVINIYNDEPIISTKTFKQF